MNKRHGITIDLSDQAADPATAPLPPHLVRDLLVDSYDLVVAGLPARLSPALTARCRPPAAAAAPSSAAGAAEVEVR